MNVHLYSELPSHIDNTKVETSLRHFMIKSIPNSEADEVAKECKKIISLDTPTLLKKKPSKPARKGKFLTAKERRNLGLHKLPKKANLKSEDFVDLHRLWLDYIKGVIGKITPSGRSSPPGEGVVRNLADEQMQMRLSRADFHGAFVKVTNSPNRQLLGKEGYVAMETRNTFQLVTSKNGIKTVPKKGTTLSFQVNGMLISVSTSNMCVKPAERAVKKWKNKPPYDL